MIIISTSIHVHLDQTLISQLLEKAKQRDQDAIQALCWSSDDGVRRELLPLLDKMNLKKAWFYVNEPLRRDIWEFLLAELASSAEPSTEAVKQIQSFVSAVLGPKIARELQSDQFVTLCELHKLEDLKRSVTLVASRKNVSRNIE